MSQPTTRRRSTVHDFSTLRLHPDGTRVPITSPSRDTLINSRTRNIGRDVRGNRVARDAAGLRVFPKRVVRREDDNEVQNTKPRVPRHRKRRRIDDHVEFLGDSGSSVRRAGGDMTDANGESMNWPVPSSDLLKCVHYFASQYYASRGLLSDRSRKYRREVRQRRAGHALAVAGGEMAEAGADAGGDDPSTQGGEDHEDDSGKDDPCDGGLAEKRGSNEGRGSPSEGVPDMYRALDGSALMAIGMLLQEHISMLLKPNIPLGWEEEMD